MNRQVYNLLIVDDDASIQEMLGRLVNWEKHGFHIVSFEANGESAWEIIENNSVDILISDIKMPVMDGIQLLKKIDEQYPNIQVILLTECREFEYARQAVRYNAFDYLLKPVDKEQLWHTILRATSVIEENKKLQLSSYRKNQVLYGEELEERNDGIDIITLPSAQLLQHIRLGLQEEVKRDIESVFENLHSMKYISLESTRMIVTELAIVAFKGQTISGESNVSYLHFLKEIQRITTIGGLKSKILSLATQIAISRREERTGQKKIAEDALAYLGEHFNEESLCLSDVAEHMYISETYLSIVLKQETGETFSAHLLELRMKRAMKLLRTSDAKHYEIAQLVGYSNAQYFSVCFKKYTGMTPTQFREKN